MKNTIFIRSVLLLALVMITSCEKEDDQHWPVANFTYQVEEGYTVLFTVEAVEADSLLWLFGDGDSSIKWNPVHTFATHGPHEVTLYVSNAVGEDQITKTVEMIQNDPTVDFSVQNNSLERDDTIIFVNNSTETETSLWSFGDGSTSTQRDPQHVYKEAGTYAVTLTVENSRGVTATITKQLIILLPRIERICPTCNDTLTPDGYGQWRFNNTGPDGTYTLYNTDPNFVRIIGDCGWTIYNHHDGGIGDTYEVTSCNQGVILKWAYKVFREATVQEGWYGCTDKGIRIGDSFTTVYEAYPNLKLWAEDANLYQIDEATYRIQMTFDASSTLKKVYIYSWQ